MRKYFLITGLLLGLTILWAAGPSEMDFAYNAEYREITIYITHNVDDPESEYIEEVRIVHDNPGGSGNPPIQEGKLRDGLDQERVIDELELERRRDWEEHTMDSGYGEVLEKTEVEEEVTIDDTNPVIIQKMNRQDNEQGVKLIYRIPGAKEGDALNIIATTNEGERLIRRCVIN